MRLSELNKKIKERHLKVACFTPEQCVYAISVSHPDEVYRKRTVEFFERHIEASVLLDCDTMVVSTGFAYLDVDAEEAFKWMEDSFVKISRKAEKEGVELVLLQQDIAELDFDVPNLDCILCACDGFNYLTYDDELESVFEKSYELLKDDGVFIFDISSYYKLSTILGNNMYGENREDVAYMWQNYFDSEENVVEMELAFFIKEEDGRFTRFEEVHQQRAYTEKEVLKMLKKAGFTNVKTYGDFTFEDPKEDSERIFFVCKK